MDKENIQKIVYEFPKEEFDNLMAGIEQLRNASPPEVVPVVDEFGRIPVHEFSYQLGISKTTVNLMAAGRHASGFRLKVFRKNGTKQVWTLQSEVERYFEGFGSSASPS